MDFITAEQRSRISKGFTEPFYVLHVATDEPNGNTSVHVAGSQRHVYTISIDDDGTIKCNCPDLRSKGKIWCKHICFTLFKVAKLDVQTINGPNRLSPESQKIVKSTLALCLVNKKYVNQVLSDRFKAISLPDASFVRNGDDVCPICYDPMKNSDIQVCNVCNNGIHVGCLDRWVNHLHSNSQRVSCVFCRTSLQQEIQNGKLYWRV